MLSGAETRSLHFMVLDDGNFQHAPFWRQTALALSENPAFINAWHTSEHELARRFHTDLATLRARLAELPSEEEDVWAGTVEAVNRLIETCDLAGRRFEPQHKMIGGLAVAHVYYLCAAMQHALGFACTEFARERLAPLEPEYTFPPEEAGALDLTIRLLSTSAENYRKSEMAFMAAAEIFSAVLAFMDHVRRELQAQSRSMPMSGLFSGLGRFLKVGPGVVQVREHFDDTALTETVAASRDISREAVARATDLREETDHALMQLAERNEWPEI
ncbi:MAG: hypothetical protein ACOC91_02700 [bacterium]